MGGDIISRYWTQLLGLRFVYEIIFKKFLNIINRISEMFHIIKDQQ